MLPLYRMIAVLFLSFACASSSAQNFWQALDGPHGVSNVEAISSDASGRLFMFMDRQVYFSTDNGDSWTNCSNGLPLLQNFTYINKFLPSPSGTFYASFYYADDIYRYQPATNSWALVASPAGNEGLGDADIDPQGMIWVVSKYNNGQIFYSSDEGQSFQQLSLNGQMLNSAQMLAAFNDDHNLVATYSGIYHFTTAGDIQSVFSGGGSISYLGYNPYSGTAFYGDFDNSKRSTDGGLNWESIIFTPGAPLQPEIRDMHFEPGGKIWAHTPDGTFLSENDSQTWTKYQPFSSINGVFHQAASDTWFATNSCSYPSLGRTTDSGETWTDLSKQFQSPSVQDITKDASGNLYAQTCYRGASEMSADEGQTWTDFIITDSTAVYVASLAARPDGVMMAVGRNGRYYRSLNNGADWTQMTVDNWWLVDEFYDKVYLDYLGAFYLVSYFGDIFRSTDNGDSWPQLNFWVHPFHDDVPPAFHPNGDIYASDGSIAVHYHADVDSTSWLELNGQLLFDISNIHCTRAGSVFLATSQFPGNSVLLKIPNGSDVIEPIPFFEGNFNILAITSNAENHVFVATNSTLYKSEDDGANWEIVGAMPDANLSCLYVSPDQYLYAGFYGNVVHRSAQPTAESNFIVGKIWLDDDGDCEPDAGEKNQTGVAVIASGNGDYTGFSGYNGNFTFSAPSGTYTLNVKTPNALFEPCFSNVPVTLDGPNDSAVVNLPLKVAAQCPYLSVNLTTPILRRCFNITYTVYYKNEGTAAATGAYVDVTLDSMFIFISSTLPVAGQNGLTYTFNVGDLEPGQSGTFNIVVNVSCEASLGQTHCIASQIHPADVCLPTLPPLAFYRECRENIGSFDPNDKRAFVNGNEEPGYVLPGADIEYLIRFQNTGTDTAFRIVVEDRLSSLLDAASVTPLVASHPFTMEMKDQRTLRFVFDNIMLPDSNINEPASHGFTKFRVSQAAGVPPGMVIKNDADIFFDFNAPVRTNESSLVVGTVSTKPEPGNPYSVVTYPNPFSQAVTFEIKGPDLPGKGTLRLLDVLGRQVLRQEFAGEKFAVQRNALEPGLYFFRIESGGKRIGEGKVAAK